MASKKQIQIRAALKKLHKAQKLVANLAAKTEQDLHASSPSSRERLDSVLQATTSDADELRTRILSLNKALKGRLGRDDLPFEELLAPHTPESLSLASATSVSEESDEQGLEEDALEDQDGTSDAPIGTAYPEFDPAMALEFSRVKWDWGQETENCMSGIPCVVKHPNFEWYVLACPVCGGNSTRTGGYLKGAKAFYDHLLEGHCSDICKGAGLAVRIERCQMRRLTGPEILDLMAGTWLDINFDYMHPKLVARGQLVGTVETRKASRKRKAGLRKGIEEDQATDKLAESEIGEHGGTGFGEHEAGEAHDDDAGGAFVEPLAKKRRTGLGRSSDLVDTTHAQNGDLRVHQGENAQQNDFEEAADEYGSDVYGSGEGKSLESEDEDEGGVPLSVPMSEMGVTAKKVNASKLSRDMDAVSVPGRKTNDFDAD